MGHFSVEIIVPKGSLLSGNQQPDVRIDSVPGSAELIARRAGNMPLVEWRVPYTDLRIHRISEGANAEKYLISADTVVRVPELYASIRDFDQRSDASQDFFEFYALTPGKLLPPKWYLWIEALPDWTRASIAGETVWQWVGLVLALSILFGGFWAIQRVRRRKRAASGAGSNVSRLLGPILLIVACLLALGAIEELNISGTVSEIVVGIVHTIFFAAGAWFAYLLCDGIGEWIVSWPRINPASLDASLIRLVGRTLGMAGAIAVGFLGATEIGLPIYGVIAGLGVGGLALGLAARPTLENLIGGLILYADKPVRVGDICQFGDKRGIVEDIGIRSTRIRALDRTIITIPNAEFSSMELVNYSRRDRTHLRMNVNLRYETTLAELEAVLSAIRQMLLDHPDVVSDTVRVRFNELGAYSLGIQINAYIDRDTHSGFLEVQEAILLSIVRIVEECGTAIAFPSQTTYYGRDPGLSAEKTVESSIRPARPTIDPAARTST